MTRLHVSFTGITSASILTEPWITITMLDKKVSRTKLLISGFLISIGIILFLIARSRMIPEYDIENCVDCVHYTSRVNDMVHKWDHVDGNPQFFQYALMRSCRGQVLSSGACPKFRREFRKDPARYMKETQNPYDACVSIKACQ
ncbi:hypothetical protein BDW59DRAFT_155206 [Aspergillus cavernicola]|uniref:Saposin B-type domain-containing protein n=1 Tax=Aspergillus cavernicola TaxID=176166 RepID=A0ABR4HB33_9EURO